MHHPHVHAVVSGGGISADGSRWIPCKQSKKTGKPFFMDVHVLSAVFRGKFIAYLKRAYASGQLEFCGQLGPCAKPAGFNRLLRKAVSQRWVVYAKRPFSSPGCVLKYLARYTHSVAISNQRLLDLGGGRVRFRYKDYADAQQTKVMTLASEEFMRRFLMHTLPTGFVRIRYYGFLALRCRERELERCRQLLGVPVTQEPACQDEPPPSEDAESAAETTPCPVCKTGILAPKCTLLPHPPLRVRPPHFLRSPNASVTYNDSS
jgi:hypothetical protein